jgi:hypothetical protein
MADSYISEAMRAALGTRLSRRVSFPVSASDIRRWALATYYPEEPPRVFWDEAYAATSVHGGIVAPEEFNPFAWMAASTEALDTTVSDDPDNTDYYERSAGIEGPGLSFQLNGGQEATYGVRMRPGDVITSESRLASYTEREGRLGLMLFTITEDTWTNQRDELVRTTRSTLIRY